MNKSTTNLIIKTLKIATWVGIAAAIFFMFVSFRTGDVAEGKVNTYKSLIALAIGYSCNFVVKRMTKLFPNEDEE